MDNTPPRVGEVIPHSDGHATWQIVITKQSLQNSTTVI
jgi:hypothetical protein